MRGRFLWFLCVLCPASATARAVIRQPPRAARPRVLIIYDMEGISNVDRESMVECDSTADYARGVSGLESDVNAVIDGLLAGGAGSVFVADRHGSGCYPDLPAAKLSHQAAYVDENKDTTAIWRRPWDAVVLVGMHAGSGSGGFLPHTDVWGFARLVNGRLISEAEEFAYKFGEEDVPVVLVSGDDILEKQLRLSMPWIQYVRVKNAKSVSSATLSDPNAVRSALRRSAADAMRLIPHAPRLRLAVPFRAGLRALPPMTTLRVLRDVPGVDLDGETVTFSAANWQAAENGWRGLVRVGNSSLRLDMYQRPDYANKSRYELWIYAESLSAAAFGQRTPNER